MDRTVYYNIVSNQTSYQSSPIVSPKVNGSLGQNHGRRSVRIGGKLEDKQSLLTARSNAWEKDGGCQKDPYSSRKCVSTPLDTGEKHQANVKKEGRGGLTRKLIHSGISNVAIPNKKDREDIEFQYGNVLVLHLQCKNISTLTLGALDPFFNLKNLYLYKNNIRRIQGLEALTSLEMLDLSRNNVERIDNLENCPKLRTLFLGFNEIQVVEGLDGLANLEELHIDDQDVPPGQPLLFSPGIMASVASSLVFLDISSNQLTSLAPLEGLPVLRTLLAGNNRLTNIDDLVDILQSLRQLTVLTLKGNPISTKPYYKTKIIGSVLRLVTLDGKEINDTTRTCVQRLRLMKDYRAQRQEAEQLKKQAEPKPPPVYGSHHIDPCQPSEFTFSTPTRQSPLPSPKLIAQKKAMNMKAVQSHADQFDSQNAEMSTIYQMRSRNPADDRFLQESSDTQMSDMAKIIFRLSNLDGLGSGDASALSSTKPDIWNHQGMAPGMNECRPLSPLEDTSEYHAGFPTPRSPLPYEMNLDTLKSSRPKPAAPGGRQNSSNSSSQNSLSNFSMTGSQFQPRHYYGGTLSPLIELPTPESLTAREENPPE